MRRTQSVEGRWHQIVDSPSTFLETSVTAMCLYSLATAVSEGWLTAADYDDTIQRAWKGLSSQIAPSGNVSNICSGCGIQTTPEAYENHPRDYAHSQPGLGSVFRAIFAYDKYENRASRP